MFHHRLTLPQFAELKPELEGVENHEGSPAYLTAKHQDLGMVIWLQDPFKGDGLLVSQRDMPRFLEDGAS